MKQLYLPNNYTKDSYNSTVTVNIVTSRLTARGSIPFRAGVFPSSQRADRLTDHQVSDPVLRTVPFLKVRAVGV
jgi:hypothetical protein